MIRMERLPRDLENELRATLADLADVELPADIRKRFGQLAASDDASAVSDRVAKTLDDISKGSTPSRDEIWATVTDLAKSLRRPGESEAGAISRACASEDGKRLYTAYCQALPDPRPVVEKRATLDDDMPEWDAILDAASGVVRKSGRALSTAQAIAEAVRENPSLYADYLAAKAR